MTQKCVWSMGVHLFRGETTSPRTGEPSSVRSTCPIRIGGPGRPVRGSTVPAQKCFLPSQQKRQGYLTSPEPSNFGNNSLLEAFAGVKISKKEGFLG